VIGHRSIIEYRRRGEKPSAIFIEAGFQPLLYRFEFEKQERAIDHGFYPTVTVTPEEIGQRLDLRFCTGCRVHVHAKDLSDEVLAFAEQVVNAGASHVIVAAVSSAEILEWKGEWIGYADSCA